MVQKCPRKVFRNSGNCWISEMWTVQPKIPEIPEAKLNGKQSPGKNFQKIWVYLARLSSFVEILENALPLTSGSCWKFKADVLVERKAPDVCETSTVIAVKSDDVSCPDLNSRDWLKQNFNQSEGRKLSLFLLIFYPPTDFAPHPTIWTPGKV